VVGTQEFARHVADALEARLTDLRATASRAA
jgi:hypothetical protein